MFVKKLKLVKINSKSIWKVIFKFKPLKLVIDVHLRKKIVKSHKKVFTDNI